MFALLLLGCSNYTPPGDGVSKGCVDVATIPHGLARGLGLSSHLEWEDDEASTARREFEVDQWGALGPGNVRRDVLWRDLEPERGTWDLALMDRLFDALDTVDADLMALMAFCACVWCWVLYGLPPRLFFFHAVHATRRVADAERSPRPPILTGICACAQLRRSG